MEQKHPPAEGVGRREETQDGEPGRQHAPEHQPHHDRQAHRDRNARIKWWLLVAAMFLVPALLLLLSVRFRGTRYVMAQLKGMRILFGEPTFLLWHVVSYLSVVVGPWLLRRYGRNRKKAIWVLVLILVPLVLVVNTWNIASTTRGIVSQRAEEMSDETFTSINSQLQEPSRSTSDLVILDQGIAKLMSYIHLKVRSDFPEFDLRTASLHMVPSGVHKDKIWNVIQEGSLRKDAEFLGNPEAEPKIVSLVGLTIKEAKVKYCPDVMPDVAGHDQTPEDCKTFQLPPWMAAPPYKSLVCYPLETGLSSKVFASLCFDSATAHAFDGKTDELKRSIYTQMNKLSGLLQLYRKQDQFIFQDSQPEAKPPDGAHQP